MEITMGSFAGTLCSRAHSVLSFNELFLVFLILGAEANGIPTSTPGTTRPVALVCPLCRISSQGHEESLAQDYVRAIVHDEHDYEAHFNLAADLAKASELDAAARHYRQVITLCPSLASAHFNYGLVLLVRKEPAKAHNEFLETLRCDPEHDKARLRVMTYLKEKDRHSELVELCQTFLKRHPDDAGIRHYLAYAYYELSRTEDALVEYRKAVALDPKNGQLMLDHANLLNLTRGPELAQEFYQALEEEGIKGIGLTYNIAYTHKKLGNNKTAIQMLEDIVAQHPKYAAAHFALATAYLACGDYERGWRDYEWRWQQDVHAQRSYDGPLWDGSSRLDGKTILLHGEQGLGDMIQFVRYAAIVKNMGATVIVAVANPLVKLLSRCTFIDKVVSFNEQPPHFDAHAPLMSIPLITHAFDEASIPRATPYLCADPELVEYWRAQLSGDTNFKIGICWQGNPNYALYVLRLIVAAKSVRAGIFARLTNLEGVSVYVLQRYDAHEANELDGTPCKFFDTSFDNDHGRFMDTAAVMKNLDLVVTIDTSLAHLAGGLGVPVWVMLPKVADWRWLEGRSDTPWYPSMRLFRQEVADNWELVFDEVIAELKPLVEHHKLRVGAASDDARSN